MRFNNKICGTCYWHQYEYINSDWRCVNDSSDYCTDWTDYDDTCDEWTAKNTNGGE